MLKNPASITTLSYYSNALKPSLLSSHIICDPSPNLTSFSERFMTSGFCFAACRHFVWRFSFVLRFTGYEVKKDYRLWNRIEKKKNLQKLRDVISFLHLGYLIHKSFDLSLLVISSIHFCPRTVQSIYIPGIQVFCLLCCFQKFYVMQTRTLWSAYSFSIRQTIFIMAI